MDLPSHCDILCGQTSTNKHPGNVFFRQLILAKVDDYMLSTKKAQKGLIAAEILDELNNNGARFMKLDKKTKQWRTYSSAEAREKVCHAIRDRVRERKKGKIVLPDLPLPSAPIANAALNGGKRTSINTKLQKLLNSKPTVSATKTRSVKVVQGGDCIVTLTATLKESGHLVSEDEDCSCSSDGSTMTSLVSLSKHEFPVVGCYVANNDTVTPAPILSYYYVEPAPGDCDFILGDVLDLGLSSPFDDIDYSVSGDEDDSSLNLDDFNDLMVNDFANDSYEDDPYWIMSTLQEACSIVQED